MRSSQTCGLAMPTDGWISASSAASRTAAISRPKLTSSSLYFSVRIRGKRLIKIFRTNSNAITAVTGQARLATTFAMKVRLSIDQFAALTPALRHDPMTLLYARRKTGARKSRRRGITTSGLAPSSCPNPSTSRTVQPRRSSSFRCSDTKGPMRMLCPSAMN